MIKALLLCQGWLLLCRPLLLLVQLLAGLQSKPRICLEEWSRRHLAVLTLASDEAKLLFDADFAQTSEPELKRVERGRLAACKGKHCERPSLNIVACLRGHVLGTRWNPQVGCPHLPKHAEQVDWDKPRRCCLTAVTEAPLPVDARSYAHSHADVVNQCSFESPVNGHVGQLSFLRKHQFYPILWYCMAWRCMMWLKTDQNDSKFI